MIIKQAYRLQSVEKNKKTCTNNCHYKSFKIQYQCCLLNQRRYTTFNTLKNVSHVTYYTLQVITETWGLILDKQRGDFQRPSKAILYKQDSFKYLYFILTNYNFLSTNMFILLLLTFGLQCKTAAVKNDKSIGIHFFFVKKKILRFLTDMSMGIT